MTWVKHRNLAIDYIRTETGDHNAVPLLRCAIVGRIQLDDPNLVMKVGGRLGQPLHDRVQIARKLRSRDATHVFKQKAARADFANCANCLRPHVTVIVVATMFPADAKGLAWRAARDQIGPCITPPINLPHVFANNRPMLDVFNALRPIVKDSFDGITVPFNHELVAKARLGKAESQAPATGEQFNAVHEPKPLS
jgi:hypothetical protein